MDYIRVTKENIDTFDTVCHAVCSPPFLRAVSGFPTNPETRTIVVSTSSDNNS